MPTTKNSRITNEKCIMGLDLCENQYYKIIIPQNAGIDNVIEVPIPGQETNKLFRITETMIEKGSFLIPIMNYK